MTKHIKVLLSGFLISFVGAIPLGILNSTAFQIAALKSVEEALHFSVSVVIVELIVVRLTLLYSNKIKLDNKIFRYVLPLAIVLLLYLALSSFISHNADKTIVVGMTVFPMIKSTILLGILLSALNPLQIPFWMGWNSVLIKRKMLYKSTGMYVAYIAGIGIGSMATLLIFIYAGVYIFNNYEQYNSLVQIFMGCVYLIFSLYLIFLLYKNHLKLNIYKLFHWEYWDMKVIYYPMFPVWLYFAIKARSFFFFSAANPSIKNGGMAMESKKEIYDLIPSQHIPKTTLIKENTPLSEILKVVSDKGFTYPLIAKPDIGMKSFGVSKIEDTKNLESYINRISEDFLIQEYIGYPKEFGIFYVRFPNEIKGRITGIVSKKFLSVIGDGKASILQLIKQNPRSLIQLPYLKKKHGSILNTILAINEKFILVPYGSHTRGAKFNDESNKINEKLVNKIDSICTQIPGFYYGRLDIICSSLEDLSHGKKYSIIEINGAGSEPTHIYDSKHSLFFAWKEITRHWKLLYQISKINNKKGHAYLSYKDGTAMLKANNKLESELKLI